MSVQSLIQNRLASIEEQLVDFKKKFDGSPCEAFLWANNAIAAAAEQHVMRASLLMLERSCGNLDAFETLVKAELRRLSTAGMARSTGALDAPIRAEQIRAWTDVVGFIEWQKED